MEFGAFKWGKKRKRGVYLDFEYLLLLCYNEKNLGRKGTGYVLGNDIVEKENMLDMRKIIIQSPRNIALACMYFVISFLQYCCLVKFCAFIPLTPSWPFSIKYILTPFHPIHFPY